MLPCALMELERQDLSRNCCHSVLWNELLKQAKDGITEWILHNYSNEEKLWYCCRVSSPWPSHIDIILGLSPTMKHRRLLIWDPLPEKTRASPFKCLQCSGCWRRWRKEPGHEHPLCRPSSQRTFGISTTGIKIMDSKYKLTKSCQRVPNYFQCRLTTPERMLIEPKFLLSYCRCKPDRTIWDWKSSNIFEILYFLEYFLYQSVPHCSQY